MGFWSSVGSVVKGAAENIAATSQEAKVIAEGYRSEDDDYLGSPQKTEKIVR